MKFERYRDLEIPENLLEVYLKRKDLDWAAKLIDPLAYDKFYTGDGFDRMQYVNRLFAARHIAEHIISKAKGE